MVQMNNNKHDGYTSRDKHRGRDGVFDNIDGNVVDHNRNKNTIITIYESLKIVRTKLLAFKQTEKRKNTS